MLFAPFKKLKAGPSILIGGLSFLFFILLVILTYNYYFYTAWDPGAVVSLANLLAANDDITSLIPYFSRCSNNVTLACIYSKVILLLSFWGIKDGYYACILFQCFLFAITSYLVYRVTGMLSNKRNAIVAYILYILLIGLSPWVIVPYSDATGLFFPVLFVFLYLTYKQSDHKVTRLITNIILFTLAPLAFRIKPQLFIIVIAIFLDQLIFFNANENIRKYTLHLLGNIFCLFVGFFLVATFVNSFSISLNEESDYGIWYYLCIGSNIEYNGVCNIPDQDYALSFDSKQERDNALKDLFFNRLKENGLLGTAKLMIRKNRLNYSDGTFGWFQEDSGHFYRGAGSNTDTYIHALLSSFYYESGGRFFVFKQYMQVLWYAIIVFVIISIFNNIHNSNISFIILALIGLTIFEMIFESRARYMFTYAPLFIIIAGTLNFTPIKRNQIYS